MTPAEPLKIYISGLISHAPQHERRQAFHEAEQWLCKAGFIPFNPFNNGLPAAAHWREHMRADIAALLRCDAIYMLRGWEQSKGAKLELDVASSCGLRVLYQEQSQSLFPERLPALENTENPAATAPQQEAADPDNHNTNKKNKPKKQTKKHNTQWQQD